MKAEVVLMFNGRDIPGGVEAMLAAIGCGPDASIIEWVEVLRRLDVTVTLLDTDERMKRLVERLEQLGISFGLSYHDRYTDEELDNARLIVVCPNYQCDVAGGTDFGTTYDPTGACPACGAGARQNSALFLDGDDDELPKLQGHRAAYTYADEVFIDERLAEEIEKVASGLVLHNVYARMPDNRQVRLRWKQLSSDRILPPMSPRTMGLFRTYPCVKCSRSGYCIGASEAPLRIVYRASDLAGAGDVNLTWEGGRGIVEHDSGKWYPSVPWLLVTPKIMRVLRNAGVTEFVWKPIHVIDE